MRSVLRTRSRAVVAMLLGGGVAFAVSAPVWLRTTVATALEPEVTVEVTGTSAAPAVTAAAFVVVAGALAVTLAGRVARWVALVAVAVAGAVVAGGALAVLRDTEGPAVAAAADAAGVTTLTSPISVTFWPWLAAGTGLCIVVVAVLAAVGSGSWSSAGGRHERPGTGGDRALGAPDGDGAERSAPPVSDEPDAQTDWDALSRGTDPSSER